MHYSYYLYFQAYMWHKGRHMAFIISFHSFLDYLMFKMVPMFKEQFYLCSQLLSRLYSEENISSRLEIISVSFLQRTRAVKFLSSRLKEINKRKGTYHIQMQT